MSRPHWAPARFWLVEVRPRRSRAGAARRGLAASAGCRASACLLHGSVEESTLWAPARVGREARGCRSLHARWRAARLVILAEHVAVEQGDEADERRAYWTLAAYPRCSTDREDPTRQAVLLG